MDAYDDRKQYRKAVNAKDLTFYRVTYKQTDLLVGSEKNHHDIILDAIINARDILDEHIENNTNFLESLTPIGYNVHDNIIVKNMCDASKKADVGPMATVAGAFSKVAFDAINTLSYEIIIENGGDLLIRSKKDRVVALYAGKSALSMTLGVLVKGSNKPIGICSSAGKIGHSISFGNADLAMVMSEDVYLADGLATKLGNLIQSKADLKPAVEKIFNSDSVIAAIGIIDENIAVIGDTKIVPI